MTPSVIANDAVIGPESQINSAILIIGGSVLGLGLFSRTLKLLGIPDPFALLLVGAAVGPKGLALLSPEQWGEPQAIMEQIARLALATGLMGVALRLPKNYLLQRWKSVLTLLIGSMVFMWLSSSIIIGICINCGLWPALLLGAILTPTDPVVASSIVTGPVAKAKLPSEVRHLLSAESGINDGLGYVFVMLPVLAMQEPLEVIWSKWLFDVIVWEIAFAVLLGLLLGYLAGRMLVFAEKHKAIEEPSILAYTIALALTTLAGVKLTGSDGILAVFFAGVAFDQVVSVKQRNQEQRVVEGIDRFFTLPIFAFLGLVIPWDNWYELGWKGPTIVIMLLLFRRLPLILLAGRYLGNLRRWPDRFFAGWFGPIGVAALYYAAFTSKQTEIASPWPLVSLTVCASLFVHGITATPFAKLYSNFKH